MTELNFLLQEVPFFQDIHSSDLQQLQPLFRQKSYRKGETIFMEGETGDEFFIVKSGVVKIFRMEESKEIILAIFHEGDYFGEMAVLDRAQVRSASAETMEKTELYVLKRPHFIHLLENSPKLTLKLLAFAMDRLRTTNEIIKDLTTLDAPSRIYRMILRLSREYGCEFNGGILIDLKLTHQQIADMTSTVRETVSKTLSELQSQGIIRIDKKKIWIRNVDGLYAKMD